MDSKQLFAAMETDITLSLRTFNAAASDLVDATFIIAASKISNVLRSIARSRPLYEFFAREIEEYNFVEEFRAHQTQDKNGGTVIVLPDDKLEQLRFTFCLLYAVDSNKIDFANLLHKCYHAIDANAEFAKFCNAIIKPFVINVNEVFGSVPSAEIATTISAENHHTLEEVFGQAEKNALDEQILAELNDITARIIHTVSHDVTLTIVGREELLLICDAFIQALGFGERKSIRLMYIALKNSLFACPIYDELQEDCESLIAAADDLLEKTTE